MAEELRPSPVDKSQITDGTQMQRWEYAVADFTKLKKAVAELDRLGAEGWEAVGLVSTWGAGWRFVHPVVLLKRPRTGPEQ
jgi:hypothetical protein